MVILKQYEGYPGEFLIKKKITAKKIEVFASFLYSHYDALGMKTNAIAVLLLCIAAISVSGCMALSGSGSSSTQSVKEVVYTPADSGLTWGSSRLSYAANDNIAMPAPTSAPAFIGETGATIESKIIKTAYLTIEVQDIPGTIESIKGLVAANGGYISSTNIQKRYNNQLSGTVVLRVPQAEFDNILAGVKEYGTVKSISTQGEDVTEQYVDLQAQKTSYQNQLAQYNAIMKKAEKVEDVITVQEQIDRVQTELDRLEGRLRYLNSRIDLSTITVNLEEPEPVGGETGYNFVSTINNGIKGFFGMIDALIVILFTILPLIILGCAGYGIYRWKKGKKPEVQEKNEKSS